ncbi:MAG: RDD family protein [Thermoguttaceae bacterium]|nr:RDD family protein [Thermoguttaceae bacterium]
MSAQSDMVASPPHAQMVERVDNGDSPHYASAMGRFAAYFVDGLVVNLLVMVIPLPITIMTLSIIDVDPSGFGVKFSPILCFTGVVGCYFAMGISGPHQATPGMRMMNIRVTRIRGTSVGFGAA